MKLQITIAVIMTASLTMNAVQAWEYFHVAERIALHTEVKQTATADDMLGFIRLPVKKMKG